MYYDVDKIYTVKELEVLSFDSLMELFMTAKEVFWRPCLPKMIRKVNSDIATIRTVLRGFNSNHNKQHDNEGSDYDWTESKTVKGK